MLIHNHCKMLCYNIEVAGTYSLFFSVTLVLATDVENLSSSEWSGSNNIFHIMRSHDMKSRYFFNKIVSFNTNKMFSILWELTEFESYA